MKKKDNQTPPTPAEPAAMSLSERETWEERGFTLGPVVEGRIILNPPPGMIASLRRSQGNQKVKRLDIGEALALRAERSFRQAKEKWTKMNREYPATPADHSALERLKADFKGIGTAFFIEGALIIGADPTRCSLEESSWFLTYFPEDFHFRFRIITDFIRIPRTIGDGEKLLESLERCEKAMEERAIEALSSTKRESQENSLPPNENPKSFLRRNKMEADKIQGCLTGVAVGDALGAPFEGSSPLSKKIEAIGGWIDDFYPLGTSGAWWTDDTGMTLASIRAFIDREKTRKSLERCFREAFYSWINSDESRASGQTVKYAAKYGVSDKNSFATGAIMRIAPVAIYAHLKGFDVLQTAELAYRVANLTHGHPLATFPAVECALALLSIFRGEESVPSYIDDPEALLTRLDPDQEDERRRYRNLRHRPADEMPGFSGLSVWKCVLENCLGLRPGVKWKNLPGFHDGILCAVNNCPDRDTSGAVAGGILGAYWGLEGIPETWKTRVKKGEQMLALADNLIRVTKKSTKASKEVSNGNK